MINRIVGGIGWFVLVIAAFILGIYNYLNFVFLAIAIFEIYRMYKAKNTNFAFIYGFIFTIGIFALNYIYSVNAPLLLLLIISIMMCDTFAYFTGKAIGKHHFSAISPNKTIEGLIGGISISIIIDIILIKVFPYFGDLMPISNLGFIILIVVILIAGIYGDLLESKLKRITGVKDSGNIVYGHGGICDRVDSWVVAAIPMALAVMIF